MRILDILRGLFPANSEPEPDEIVARDRVLLPGLDGELIDITEEEGNER